VGTTEQKSSHTLFAILTDSCAEGKWLRWFLHLAIGSLGAVKVVRKFIGRASLQTNRAALVADWERGISLNALARVSKASVCPVLAEARERVSKKGLARGGMWPLKISHLWQRYTKINVCLV
jgi:hypothetical protein